MKTFSIVRKMALMLFALLCIGSSFAVDANEVSTRSTSALTIDPSMGYIVTGLGELKDQVAVVFTNSAAAATWQAPKNLKNVEFLAVGGGGGGGGHYKHASDKTKYQGGAGGGGGAVVTGFIKDLAANQVVNVIVGMGGEGGDATTSDTTGAGKGYNGGNSIIKVDDLTYITAYGGGGDGGYNSTGVANGGSNSGARGAKSAVALKSVTVVGSGVESLVTDVLSRVNIGGSGYSTTSGYPGPGGGGAGGVGGTTHSSDVGGACGYGYVSTITGSRVVYGAGGGGGNGKNSGYGTEIWDDDRPFVEGAGLGIVNQAGSDALPNQGGGGGGGSYMCAGGAGGSGVVVLRFAYSDVDVLVDVAVNIAPKIFDKVYTGEALTSGLVNTYAYTVEELGERINFGQQTVRVTLNDGYYWADGDTNRVKEFTWNINQEPNNWKVEPYLSHTSWPQIFASNSGFKFRAPETSFGILQAELSTNGAAPQPFSGTLPTEPGIYTLRYWVNSTTNWAAKEWKVDFTIYRSEDFAGGYKVYGLGEKADEVAVVFTNSISWTVPANINGSAQFLVVGGGGGGGADSSYDAASGGAGGGGGGVVTGEVDLTKGSTVNITVGAGGAGGKMSTNQRDGLTTGNYFGASKKGGDSTFVVDGTTYVTAYGGGRDQGTTLANSSKLTASTQRVGGSGGSNGGSRGGYTKAQTASAQMGVVATVDVLRNCTTYGNKGGKGCSEYFYGFPAAGGGGGATEAGGDAGNDAAGWPGGKGGQGLASEITGARVVYGSGGGGASTQGDSGGKGGEGAGDGGDREGAQGTAALANQGGGGGGSSREITYGGAGGSGIVVIRYRQLIDVDALEEVLVDRIYTGEVQTIENGSLYIVSGTVSAVDAGEYHITLTPRDGYPWSDTETNEPRNFTWRIVPASNEWISSASINTNSWTLNVDVAGVITPPKAKVGEVKAMISKDGAEEKEFDGNTSKIFEPGVYVVTYYPPESTANFTSENMTPQYVTFEVFINDIIPEYFINISEPLPVGSDRKIVIPYEVTCEAVSDKMLNLYACYTIVGEGLTKTNLVSAIKGIKGIGEYEITDLKPGAEYQISFFGDIEGTIQSVEPIITTVVPSAAMDLIVSSVTFVNDPMEFRITGSVVPGLGTTVVKVYWALNDASQLEVNAPKQFVYSIGDIGVELGKPVDFTAVISYTSLSDKLIWKVKVENSLVTDTWGEQTFAGPVKEQAEKVRMDAGAITYTWTGGGTPDENGLYKWADIRNWTPNDTTKECLGYPGTISGTKYQSKAIFAKDAKVDLNGSKMYIDGAIQMSEGISVEISNGTLGFQKTSVTLGAANSILTLKAVKLPLSASKPTDKYTIIPAARSMVVIDGDNSMDYTVYTHLKYSPTTTGKLLIKNFDGRIGYDSVAAVKDSVGELSNAKWDFFTGSGNTNNGLADKGLPMKLIFIDGEDRRAVLRSLWTFPWDDDYSKINLNGRTLDIKLKVDPTSDYHNANIMASVLSQNANCTINIDVTDYKYTKPVKILTLHSGLGDKELTYTLNVTAKGVDVTERVKAKLYWDDEKRNLYFSQSAAGTRIIVR